MEGIFLDVLQAAIGGVITGGAAWAAIKVHIAWLRADIERAHKRLDMLEQKG